MRKVYVRRPEPEFRAQSCSKSCVGEHETQVGRKTIMIILGMQKSVELNVVDLKGALACLQLTAADSMNDRNSMLFGLF